MKTYFQERKSKWNPPECKQTPGESRYPFDYCLIMLDGMLPFLRLHFLSLEQRLKLTDFNSIHVICKNTKSDVKEFCSKYEYINIHELDMYTPKNIDNPWQWDMAYNYEYIVECCGDSDFVIMIHPDVDYYNADVYWDGIYNSIRDNVGVVYEGAMSVVRREAYISSHLGFWPLMNARYMRPEDDSNGVYIVGNLSPQKIFSKGKLFNILGIEMFELFCIDIQQYGWHSIVIPEISYFARNHISDSSNHDPENVEMRKRKLDHVNSRIRKLGG